MAFKEMFILFFGKLLSRKFIMTMILAIILLIVFFVMVKNELLSETSFGLWLAGLLAAFGIYTGSNIIVKKKTDDGGTNE